MQSGLLQVLATKPGLVGEGETIDPIGRPGVGISAYQEKLGQYRLIFDSGSGRLLGGETRGKNRNGTRDDVDDNFTAWLAAGYVHSFHARP